MSKLIPISQMPMNLRHWYLLFVSSLEQLIDTTLSTIVGVVIPLLQLLGTPRINAFDQGLLGASSLAGIAVGSVLIGKLMDSMGYLMWFRICPLIIFAGSIGASLSDSVGALSFWLFFMGLGVGGGYSLDSGYISELMPARQESLCVGIAKALSSFGFIGGAAISYIILQIDSSATVWPVLILFVGATGLSSFLLRLRWYESPDWLESMGEGKRAEKAAKEFFGADAEVLPEKERHISHSQSWKSMFQGKDLDKVILGGIPWACEGLGVYGFGVFLPILVIALGLQGGNAAGIHKIMDSVLTTLMINLFVAIGFGLGLVVMHKMNILKLMGYSFIICAFSLGGLLFAYIYKWPVWTSFLCFILFELALNAGPHLVTFVVPARIFSIEERGAGVGITTMLGKLGAIAGVFFIPLLLSLGGVPLVLGFSIIIQLAGAAITFIYGKKLNLL